MEQRRKWRSVKNRTCHVVNFFLIDQGLWTRVWVKNQVKYFTFTFPLEFRSNNNKRYSHYLIFILLLISYRQTIKEIFDKFRVMSSSLMLDLINDMRQDGAYKDQEQSFSFLWQCNMLFIWENKITFH